MKSICFTGHRKVPGRSYDEWGGVYELVHKAILDAYRSDFRNFFSGGAIGFDTIAAEAVLAAKKIHGDISLIMAVPFKDQPIKWPKASQDRYNKILAQADKIVFVDEVYNSVYIGRYSSTKMLNRNKFMVNNTDVVIACLSSAAISVGGGTMHCINYAKTKERSILLLDPDTLTRYWL